jgi:AcrR family transcriptional regulator
MSARAAIARALDPAVVTPGDPASERILDAALEVGATTGMRHLTMDDVARRAGVGRMTVYRRFGDRDGLVEALVVHETRRCLRELDAASDPGQPIADQVAEGYVASLRIAARHPLLARLARSEPEVVLAAIADRRSGAFPAAVAFLASRLRASQRAGVVGDVEIEAAAEVLVRIAFSFVLLPDSGLPLDDEDRLRELARGLLTPLLAH